MSDSTRPDLTSWKEIAAHLDVTVRTAQEWEKKRGLPVRRIPGGRGRVYMRVAELEAWLESGPATSGETPVPDAGSRSSATGGGEATPSGSDSASNQSRWRRLDPVEIVVGVAILFLAGWLLLRESSSDPTRVRIERTGIVAVDDSGRELWSHDFGERLHPNLEGTEVDIEGYPAAAADIDNDGRDEVLFATSVKDYYTPAHLVAFDDDGTVLWRYVANQPLRAAGGDIYEPVFKVAAFAPITLADGTAAFVVVSRHFEMHPTEVALVAAADGRKLASYWHSGHVGTGPRQLLVHDLNGNGRPEILLGGISNGYDVATLVVLDPETMAGASDEIDPDVALLDLAAPVGDTRVLFPLSPVARATDRYNIAIDVRFGIETLTVMTQENFEEETSAALLFTLYPDLSQRDVQTSLAFEGFLKRLIEEGRLPPSAAEEVDSLPPVRYAGSGAFGVAGERREHVEGGS